MKPVICVIPARYKSSRFPGKPLELIGGKPMILWVVENASRASSVHDVVVATDDERIFNEVTNAGFKAVMTSPDCPNGSARVAEVSADLEDEFIFEMQGDQPLVDPAIIDDFIERSYKAFAEKDIVDAVIPYAKTTHEQTSSPDVLKVVVSESEKLIFQTRQPIQTGFRTLGLYLWKKDALLRFASIKPSKIEIAEDSHPIRLYVNDFYVQGVLVDHDTWIEVDRPHHIEAVEQLLINNKEK